MKITIYKTTKSLIAVLLSVMLMTLFVGCNKSSDLPVPESESNQTSEPETVDDTVPLNPHTDWPYMFDEPVLPFDAAGKLFGESSELQSYLEIRYLSEGTPDYIVIANLNDKSDADAFFALMSGISKDLIAEVEDDQSHDDTLPSEAELGVVDYSMTMRIDGESYLLEFCKAEDCGHLFFMALARGPMAYYYSLYKISLEDLKSIESFLEGLEKTETQAAFAVVEEFPITEKPVIYLYPEAEQDVSVMLDFAGSLSVTYPAYNDGWNVRAYPDGTLTNYADGLEYSYLYWEGLADDKDWWDLSEGYCVPGADTAAFLQKTLSELGMTPKEYNEFIVYWLPQMQGNPYNLISFQWDEYEKIAPLEITPAPDSMLRVSMVFKPLTEPVTINAPAACPEFSRNGFTVVEWGGTKVE